MGKRRFLERPESAVRESKYKVLRLDPLPNFTTRTVDYPASGDFFNIPGESIQTIDLPCYLRAWVKFDDASNEWIPLESFTLARYGFKKFRIQLEYVGEKGAGTVEGKLFKSEKFVSILIGEGYRVERFAGLQTHTALFTNAAADWTLCGILNLQARQPATLFITPEFADMRLRVRTRLVEYWFKEVEDEPVTQDETFKVILTAPYDSVWIYAKRANPAKVVQVRVDALIARL